MTPRANVCKPPKGDKNSNNSDVLSSYDAHTVHSVSSLCSGLLMKRASRGKNGLTRGTAALCGLYDREEGLVGWLVIKSANTRAIAPGFMPAVHVM